MRKPLNLAYCRRQAAGANCSAVTGSESEDEDHAKLSKAVDAHQTRRDQCEKEVQNLNKTIARTYQFEKPEGVDVAKVEIKPLKLPDNLSQDKGTKLLALLTGWANNSVTPVRVSIG